MSSAKLSLSDSSSTGRQRETNAKKSRLSTITTKPLIEELPTAAGESPTRQGSDSSAKAKSPKWQKRKKPQKLRKAAQRELVLTSRADVPSLFRGGGAPNRAPQVGLFCHSATTWTLSCTSGTYLFSRNHSACLRESLSRLYIKLFLRTPALIYLEYIQKEPGKLCIIRQSSCHSIIKPVVCRLVDQLCRQSLQSAPMSRQIQTCWVSPLLVWYCQMKTETVTRLCQCRMLRKDVTLVRKTSHQESHIFWASSASFRLTVSRTMQQAYTLWKKIFKSSAECWPWVILLSNSASWEAQISDYLSLQLFVYRGR